jgi:OOP family OmpA-OmpF porin
VSSTQGDPADSLETLRGLLVGPEQRRLTEVERREKLTAGQVGDVLPEAVAGTQGTPKGQQLAISLEPTVTALLRSLAKKEAELFGEILSPTIGAAVRKAVSDAIAAMLQRFNETLERSLSVQSLRWRLEARQTGRPFAEVVLLHTLVYRVEQVFMIHPRTGLLLEHVADPVVAPREPDQVAALLEAIDAYAREAFGAPAEGHLSQVHFGDRMIWIDRTPSLAVAAVVHGAAPSEFGELLRETRERLFLAHRSALARFTSDVSPFAAARPDLERCLRQQRRVPTARAHLWLLTAAFAALAAVAAVIAGSIAHRMLVARCERALAKEPGVFVTSASWSGGRVQLAGFSDPLATSPGEVLARRGLGPAALHFEPFVSLDPTIVVRRARRSLAPPGTVVLALVDHTLHAKGAAPRRWIEQARLLSRAIPGVDRLDETDLRSQEDLDQLARSAAALETLELSFATGSSQPGGHAELQRAVAGARQVIDAAALARRPVCLTVTGYADPTGSLDANHVLSEARAQRVARALADGGVPASSLRPVPGDVRQGQTLAEAARRVTFDVAVGACAGPP